MIVMQSIKNVSRNGRTVMVTIHQPSIDIFETFDALVLLRRGGTVSARLSIILHIAAKYAQAIAPWVHLSSREPESTLPIPVYIFASPICAHITVAMSGLYTIYIFRTGAVKISFDSSGTLLTAHQMNITLVQFICPALPQQQSAVSMAHLAALLSGSRQSDLAQKIG